MLRGLLKIAEVVSRFDSVDRFIEDVSKFGFNVLSKVSLSSRFFNGIILLVSFSFVNFCQMNS